MEKETRSFETAEIRAKAESREVTGLGIVFNKPSRDLGGFIEVIKPEAITGVIERSDILALLNHNYNKGVLARSKKGTGSLSLEVTDQGVSYRFVAPRYDLGEELLDGIERGDIQGSSFSFTVAPSGETWEKQDDGRYLRTITQFQELYDMSPVYNAAYNDTTVAKRSQPAGIPEPVPPVTEKQPRTAEDILLAAKISLIKYKTGQ